MRIIDNKEYLEFPYHFFCEKHPRFIGKNLLHDLVNNEISPSSLTNDDEILQAFRGFRIYTDLEKVRLYEISNAYAYEVALRTQRVKDLFYSSLEASSFEARQSDEIWIDIKEALKFENARYHNGKSRSKGLLWRSIPETTLPEVRVPSNKTDYLPINLNMYLPEKELKELLLAYVTKLEQMRARKPVNDKREQFYSNLMSNVKLIRNKKNIHSVCYPFIEKIKRPDTNTLKLTECFFAYDMIEFGFNPKSIATALENARAYMLFNTNRNLHGNDGELFSIADAEGMIAGIDTKTIKSWHKDISALVENGLYKDLISSSNPDILSTEGYL